MLRISSKNAEVLILHPKFLLDEQQLEFGYLLKNVKICKEYHKEIILSYKEISKLIMKQNLYFLTTDDELDKFNEKNKTNKTYSDRIRNFDFLEEIADKVYFFKSNDAIYYIDINERYYIKYINIFDYDNNTEVKEIVNAYLSKQDIKLFVNNFIYNFKYIPQTHLYISNNIDYIKTEN